MNWIQKTALKMVWPKAKEILINYIKNEENQKKYVELINKKLDIPNLSEESERKLLNQVYDAAQEATVEILDKVNLDVFVK